MKRHRPALVPLVAVLAATAAFQGRDQHRVLVAGDRSAAIELRGTDGEEGLSGDLEAGVDLAAGSSALRADLRLEDAEKLDDATFHAFLEATGDATEAIGELDLPVPVMQGDAPGGLDFSIRSVAGGGGSYATMDLEVAVPSDDTAPTPTVALSGTVEGSPRSVSGAVGYTVTVPEERAGRIPVTELSLSLADEATGSGEDETVTTTLSLSVTAPRGGRVAAQLRQASGAAALFEQQLRQSGVRVDTFGVSPVEETDDGVTADATVVVRDLRGTLGGFIGMAGLGMTAQDPTVDAEALAAALSQMIRTRVDSLALTMEVSGREVSGRMSGEVSRLDQFFAGYTEILRATVRSPDTARGDSVPEELAPYVTAFQEASIEQTARSVQALTESDLTFSGEGELDVRGSPGTTRVDGGFDLTVDGYRDFAETSRAAGSPVPDTALVAADVRLTDGGRLEGEYYSYSDVGLLDTYRRLAVAALERVEDDEGAAEAAARLEEARLEEAAFSAGLEGRDLTIRGYSRSTPLTGAARALLRGIEPEIDGTPEGAHLDYAFRPDGTGEGALRIYFSDFMPGRSAAEIRQALGLPDGAAVRTDAAPDAVAPTRVERPEVELSAGLTDVRASARTLAARGPGDRDGVPTWMLIAGGAAALVLLALGWAAARRGRRTSRA